MESSAAFRSFHYPINTVLHMRSSLEKPCVVPMHNATWNSQSRLCFQLLANGEKNISYQTKWKRTLVSCAKTAESIKTTKSDASSGGSPQDSLEKKPMQNYTFPNGFEALVLEVCDETEIAELKVKVGEFEMNLKRNIGAMATPISNISPVTPPPIPINPMVESAPTSPPSSPPKSSSEKSSPFINVSLEKSSKLAALEASCNNNYVLVSSPTVGSFRRGRTVKGKRQPPICKQGDVIKEGQVIGYLEQLGTELPVKSDVAGEVLRLLFEDGEAVGFGDPLVAVLPSFHGIN